MYRVYLRMQDQRVDPATKTNTSSAEAAAEAFGELVARADLDGQKVAAVLTYNQKQLAYHRFDRKPGSADYWRGRMGEIPWPPGIVGRPQEMEGGKRVNVYLDATSLARAARLGAGNVSVGIRRSLSNGEIDGQLDAASLARAAQLGDGNVLDGIRRALSRAVD
ncbi:hypothetical protein K2O51_30940 (plasmid) [Cupriavidus pinatubonensis]|uniref:hypothetical protein n=1 Tax=Cupriavidus pinatubonensis TaxID=248026 RepID=UPI001C733944|nr:hypothetical protein [Cupriavidus pinatubonensis]QYY33666.1 hypothetical protein K2O51_30940 [Cupriavidus pinatubonensis]